MNLIERDERDSQLYDPQIRGFDSTFWQTLAGTPSGSVGAGNVITLNNAVIASFPQYEFPEKAEFMMTIPAAPVGGQLSRIWGFLVPTDTQPGRAYFQTLGTAFQAVVVDNFGNQQTATLTWLAGYTATPVRYQIMWEPERIMFKINDVIVATFVTTATAALPFGALPIYIRNLVVDNMTITYVNVLRAANIIS